MPHKLVKYNNNYKCENLNETGRQGTWNWIKHAANHQHVNATQNLTP